MPWLELLELSTLLVVSKCYAFDLSKTENMRTIGECTIFSAVSFQIFHVQLLLLIVLPPAMAAGLSCWCGCLPLMCTGILIWVKCKCGYKLKRAFKNELWFPMVAGALLVLFLFDLCFLWIPGLLYLLGWCVTRIRFGKCSIWYFADLKLF